MIYPVQPPLLHIDESIPIVTNTAVIRIKDFGIEIKELTNTSVKESIIKAMNLSQCEI